MEQGDPIVMFMFGRPEALWYSKDRFHQVMKDKNLMEPFIMAGFSWEVANDFCGVEPYKSVFG